MTLNEIIVSALMELGRGHDQMSIDAHRARFTGFANDALCDIAASMKLTKKKTVYAVDGQVSLSGLDGTWLRFISASRAGKEYKDYISIENEQMYVPYDGEYQLIYTYIPASMSVASDKPDIPEFLHSLVACYVVARERMSSDVSTQKGADRYLEVYELMKARLLTATQDEYGIINKW